jgi:hypothetical protein
MGFIGLIISPGLFSKWVLNLRCWGQFFVAIYKLNILHSCLELSGLLDAFGPLDEHPMLYAQL